MQVRWGKPAKDICIILGAQNVRTGHNRFEWGYYALRGNAPEGRWSLERHSKDGRQVTTIAKTLDSKMKPHRFLSLFVEVRNAKLSVDANDEPIMTAVRLPIAPGPYFGVAASSCSFMFKDFKFQNKELQEKSVRHQDSIAAGVNIKKEVGDVGEEKGRPQFVYSDQNLVREIEGNMLTSLTGQAAVTFDDVAANDDAKRLLNEAVVLPAVVPELFSGLRSPWNGVLLYGPPGTGKTLLARAVASMGGVNFFNCSPASIVSKFRGESEKLVRCMFAMAHHYAPSIIFVDEIDALCGSRGAPTEHEASRRLKSEILVQMDGLSSRSNADPSKRVIVLATTNRPWDLDEALRRRLEKRIYVPLPDSKARMRLFSLFLSDGVTLSPDFSMLPLIDATEGYSGADIHCLCREAAMFPMRRYLSELSPERNP